MHDHVLTIGVSIGPLVLRLFLLAAIPVVAGFALLRPFFAAPGRRTAVAVTAVAGSAVLVELMLADGLDLPTQTVPLVLAVVAGPLYVLWSANTIAVRRVRVVAPWIVAGVGGAGLVEFGRAWLVGGPPETVSVLLHTGVLLGLTALTWFVVCGPLGSVATWGVRATAAVLAVAMTAGAATAITLRPPYPPGPGVIAVRDVAVGAATVAVLVVPNRPGWNLVRLPDDVVVGADPDRMAAGAAWAVVELPTGPSGLWVRYRGALGGFTTDTGDGPPAPAGLTGPDSAECVSALLGRSVGGGGPLRVCPADELLPEDANVILDLVASLAAQGVDEITLLADDSPRAKAAERAVRSTGMGIGSGGPTIVVSGWATANKAPRDAYLAPWLPARPDPTDEQARRYRAALRAAFPTESPSPAGLRAWLVGQGLPGEARVHRLPRQGYGPH